MSSYAIILIEMKSEY